MDHGYPYFQVMSPCRYPVKRLNCSALILISPHASKLKTNYAIRNAEKMPGRLIGEDIELELALSDDFDRVMADHGHIEQVIMNLSVNARDAMPGGENKKSKFSIIKWSMV
jgi:signal transduction histidine kinase